MWALNQPFIGLCAYNRLAHRDKSKPNRTITKPKALTANAPNQIYTWDITYLPTNVRGIFVYLYLVLDIYSRKVVEWQVHSEELSARFNGGYMPA
jgi:putative transposase